MGAVLKINRGGGDVSIKNSIVEEYLAEAGVIDKNTFIEFTEASTFTEPVLIHTSEGAQNCSYHNVFPIDENRFLFMYYEGSSTSNGYIKAKVVTVNDDNTFVVGTAVDVASGIEFPYAGVGLIINLVRINENEDRFIFTATYPPYNDSAMACRAGVFKVTGTAITPEVNKQIFNTYITDRGGYASSKSQLLPTAYENKFLFITSYGDSDNNGKFFSLKMSVLTVGTDTSTLKTTLSNTSFVNMSDALKTAGLPIYNANNYYASNAISGFHVVHISDNKYVLFYQNTSDGHLCQGTFTITDSGSFSYLKIQKLFSQKYSYTDNPGQVINPVKIQEDMYAFPYRAGASAVFTNRILKFDSTTNEFTIVNNSLVSIDKNSVVSQYCKGFAPDNMIVLDNRVFVRLGLNHFTELFYSGNYYLPSDIYTLSGGFAKYDRSPLPIAYLGNNRIVMTATVGDNSGKYIINACVVTLGGLKLKKSEDIVCGLLLSDATTTQKGKIAKFVP